LREWDGEREREPMPDAPLSGRCVAVTRGKQGDDPLSRRLRELGARVVEFPSIVIAPPPPDAAARFEETLRHLDGFDWAVFASGNAVEHTLVRMKASSVPVSALARLRLAAVGPVTADKLARSVRAPDLVPPQSRGEALAAALGPAVRGRRVLVPRAEEGRPELVEGLVAAGADVVAPVAYRTEPAAPETVRELGDLLERGEVDAVVFASPSAVKSVVAALGERARLLSLALVAVIGPTTAEAVRAAGFGVDVEPASPSARALADAVADRLVLG
jgi:uroporphyrinogen-III synthase